MSSMTDTLACKRRGHPHAQVHFPPLTAEEALLLCNLMDRAITALWRAHGHSMGDLLAQLPPRPASPRPASPQQLSLPHTFTDQESCPDDDIF